jgi:hypothetical protein
MMEKFMNSKQHPCSKYPYKTDMALKVTDTVTACQMSSTGFGAKHIIMHTSFVSEPVAMYPSDMERPTKFWTKCFR